MKKPQAVEEFIRNAFKLYSLDYKEFFHFMDSETGEICELPLVLNGKLEMSLVNRAAVILGVSADALMNMDEVEIWKWWDKFDYFDLKDEFDLAKQFSYLDKHDDMQRLLAAIWGGRANVKPTRYDSGDIVRRLTEQLREYDKSLPGTYHKDAQIHVYAWMANFFHYEKIERLVRDYLAMVNRTENLFFEAWDRDLSADEVSEYNFLVSALGIQDSVFHRINTVKESVDGVAGQKDYLHYDLLKRFIPVYRTENFREFFTFARIHEHHRFEPWECAEFCQNRTLVQDYVNVFPAAKQEMRNFSMAVSNVLCCYVWSDEPQPICPVSDWLAQKRLQNEETPQYHKAYVPKTPQELNGDEDVAETVKTLSGPVKLGGVLVRQPETNNVRSHTRFMARAMAAYQRGGGAHD